MLTFPIKEIVKADEAKPVLKWAGGKGSLLPQISEHFPNKLRCGAIKRYIEPFCGGAAVFFHLYNHFNFNEAYLFDINPEIIILYNAIKKDVGSLIHELSLLEKAYNLSEDKRRFYYEIRSEYNTFDKNVNTIFYCKNFMRRAALTIFLNKTCFNGLFRVNKKNLFNVPMGTYKKPCILDKFNLLAVSKALQNATIIKADFATALKYADKDSFIYYDPPYRPIKKTSFKSYTIDDFGDEEQLRLKNIFNQAAGKGALQMLSNSDPKNYNLQDTFFDDLYSEYHIYRIWAKRIINSNPKGRNGVTELLITNYTS